MSENNDGSNVINIDFLEDEFPENVYDLKVQEKRKLLFKVFRRDVVFEIKGKDSIYIRKIAFLHTKCEFRGLKILNCNRNF